ncbi:Histone-lysine N-methyltransferase SETMAR [Eumeta japonica]|uniref:Histone-lysine N-methyltransferase SETMAR n=1 Tax=Eumeta variegata TaxID=151549 RepID=A0A4C1Y5T6_EUMVA|nr:Histone-lysine N-methyltransferase SETMAR [Eumeta japonica]
MEDQRAESTLKRNETEPFYKRSLVMRNVYITYYKKMRNKLWSEDKQALQTIAQSGLTRNNLMLCVWWDRKGIIHYEPLAPGKTIHSDLSCQQLMRLKQEVEKKR